MGLYRRYALLAILDAQVLGFQLMKECYATDEDMSLIITECKKRSFQDYSVQDGFLFKGNRLCVPKENFRELIRREVHGGGLAGHFGVNKTLEILKERFHWPKMQREV